MICEYSLDLGHQLSLSIARRAVRIFLNCVLNIVIHGINIKRIKRPEIGAGDVIEILWQPLLTIFLWQGVKSCCHTWPFSSNPIHQEFNDSLQQLHIAVWIEPKALFKEVERHDIIPIWDILNDHHSLGEWNFPDTWDTTSIVGKPLIVLGIAQLVLAEIFDWEEPVHPR